jgi:hypothetical protein
MWYLCHSAILAEIYTRLQAAFQCFQSVCRPCCLCWQAMKYVDECVSATFLKCYGRSAFVPILTVSLINIMVWNVKSHLRFQISCLPMPYHWMLWFSEVYELLLASSSDVKKSFSYDSNFSFFFRSTRGSCHNLLHHSEGKKCVVLCINICSFNILWLSLDFFLKDVSVFVVMVAADIASRWSS